MKFSVEAECGYILTEKKDGGNFSGVCLGLDQAVSLIYVIRIIEWQNNKTLIPEQPCKFWDFKMGKNKTPGSVITCQRVILNLL